MTAHNNEEEQLRAVAMENAKSVLAARQRSERELLQANEALKYRTEELARAKERFENIFKYAAVGMAVMDTSGRLILANPRLCEILGYSSEELLAVGFQQLTHPEDRAEDLDMMPRLLSGEIPVYRREKRYRRKDGTFVWGHLTVSVELNVANDPVSFLAVILDITDRKLAEQTLRESEARYRSALAAGRMGAWETDLVTGTRIWSEEAMELFGLTLADGRGQAGGDGDEFRLSLHPDDRHLAKKFHELADRQDSFPAEYRIVRPDGSIRWLSGRGQVVARSPEGRAHRLVNVVVDITDRKVAENHIQFLMREISHRSKNLLAVVQSIAFQTARTAGTMDEFQTRFSQRLQGLAASHDLLVHREWQGAALDDLVRDQLSSFVEIGGPRLNASGPDVFVSPEAAESIGLALHELATNAVKYGAWSAPAGRVAVSWILEHGSGGRQLRLRWVEEGGPQPEPPSRKGFGHVVFERIVANALRGKVTMDFAPSGLNWELSIPTSNLVNER